MKYVILCSMGEINEIPKQLIEIGGESLVKRSIRLLRNECVEDIAVVANNPLFDELDVLVIHNPDADGRWMWNWYIPDEPVCYIFGDVFYSPEAIHQIVKTDTKLIRFFASSPPFADNYPKSWAEPFAFKVQDVEFFRECLLKAQDYDTKGYFKRAPCAWELWQVIRNTQLNRIDYHNYDIINDYTCDIDTEQDIEVYRKRWNECQNT